MGLVDPTGQPIAMSPTGTEDDPALLDRMNAEIAALGAAHVKLQVDPADLVMLIGFLQFVRRVAAADILDIEQEGHELIDMVVDAGREIFADCPAILEVIQRGEDGV